MTQEILRKKNIGHNKSILNLSEQASAKPVLYRNLVSDSVKVERLVL